MTVRRSPATQRCSTARPTSAECGPRSFSPARSPTRWQTIRTCSRSTATSLERLLGRESAGTLRLKQDDKGLAVEIDLPDTSDGRDVGVLIQRGDLKGMSFGFSVTKQEWDETVTPPKRTIMAVELYEVTITADPAYPDTEIGMAELAEARAEARRANRAAWLRSQGHHRSRTRVRTQIPPISG
jgi:HK97 family phage prohead protease